MIIKEMIRTSFNNSSSNNIGMLQFKTQVPLGYSKKPDTEEYPVTELSSEEGLGHDTGC